jgi:ADP-L-glycero-D-manno-heptose 6-epimerase
MNPETNQKETGNLVTPTPASNVNPDGTSAILITGAAGFIGSCMVSYLNQKGHENLVLVDEFDDEEKELNLLHKKYRVRVERENLFEWLQKEKPLVGFVFHLGARTDTTEFNYSIHQHLNVDYSKKIWDYCTINGIPLVYASSAATYGGGELGYDDDPALIDQLKPLNAYGISKNEFDKWVLHQKAHPPFWAGLKFFNVYGPNEYHKARMASVVYHSFNQIRQYGKVKLFRSHKAGVKDGEQLRDFIYVKDVVGVCYWLMQTAKEGVKFSNGIYNLGTGTARTFNELAKATFAGMDLPPSIEYIDIPEDIREKYQDFTEAKMKKLKEAGYSGEFHTLEKGVEDYVRNYLVKNLFY